MRDSATAKALVDDLIEPEDVGMTTDLVTQSGSRLPSNRAPQPSGLKSLHKSESCPEARSSE